MMVCKMGFLRYLKRKQLILIFSNKKKPRVKFLPSGRNLLFAFRFGRCKGAINL